MIFLIFSCYALLDSKLLPPKPDLHVVVGLHDREKMNEETNSVQIRSVVDIFINPRYDPDDIFLCALLLSVMKLVNL